MKTKGTKIAGGIGLLIMLVALILGVVYVLTGDVSKIDNSFIGHGYQDFLLNGTPRGEAPEIMAFASMGVFFVGMIIALIALTISQKGQSKAEKKEESKDWSAFFIGMMIGVIAAIVLAVIAPKSDTIEFKSVTWYYVILGAEVIAAITMIAGFIKGLQSTKAPLISSHSEHKPSSDEF